MNQVSKKFDKLLNSIPFPKEDVEPWIKFLQNKGISEETIEKFIILASDRACSIGISFNTVACCIFTAFEMQTPEMSINKLKYLLEGHIK